MAESVWKQCLESIADKLQTLNVYPATFHPSVRNAPFETGELSPGMYVTPEDVREGDGTNERDDYGYECAVTVVRSSPSQSSDDMEKWLKNRQLIARRFNHVRLGDIVATDVTEHICLAKTSMARHPKLADRHYDVIQVTVTCWFREPRG